MSEVLIQFENASFKYKGNSENTLENINFSINKGEYIAITGTSGSGKSTLLSLLGLLSR